MSNSRDERLALAALLDETGPESATLCTGWLTRDLAAHLVLRERRPDAAAGVMGGPVAPYTARVQRRYLKRWPYAELVAMFRAGPPRLSPFSLPGADEQGNTVEYFVHHEDVRRAQPGWQPREISDALSDALWRRVKGARFFLRKSPVGVELAREDAAGNGGSFRVTVKNATPTVTVIGTPAELTMWATGRTSAAHVRFDGTGEAIAALRAWRS